MGGTEEIGRVVVVDVAPVVLGGRRPAKAVVGEDFEVSATVFREGPDVVGAGVVLTDPEGRPGRWVAMREVGAGSDRFSAWVSAGVVGDWSFRVEGWSDPVASWWRSAGARLGACPGEAWLVWEEGARLLERAAVGVPEGEGRGRVRAVAEALRARAGGGAGDGGGVGGCLEAVEELLVGVLGSYPLRELVSCSESLPLRVERERALYGAWYEFFPRSEGTRGCAHGTLRSARRRLPWIARMGFDVVYLPPIHPIGLTCRKGRGNTLTAGEGDVGVPWAVGGLEGGHDAVHPSLGTLEDFEGFVACAEKLGLEVALDFALQCSPDHPWVRQRPGWFRRRVDGSVAFAENPPKRYEDIFPLDFDADPEGIVAESLRVLRFWMARGVRIFRVDNPHTKPVVFWERVLEGIRRTDPDVVFLAEAFTRPAMMRILAQIGFQQSYTYFTWRDSKAELTEYATELARDSAHYLRPNFFANTPDILSSYLQRGGRHAFEVRAVLAATLSPSWGIYSGFELCENIPAGPDSEEYLDSEKYRLVARDWEAARREGRDIVDLIARLNALRRAHPALRHLRNLRFHHTDNDRIIAYSKRRGDDTVLVVVNLDPHHAQEATLALDLPALGLPHPHPQPGHREAGAPHEATSARGFTVHDRLTEQTFHWHGDDYVRLDPEHTPAHILHIPPPTDHDHGHDHGLTGRHDARDVTPTRGDTAGSQSGAERP
ncbi:alpha-1,4-glucan--maltose-1-phosphate maltosyltransferase [Streptomyces sp. HSG2]|uniref:alpha-1,4-glucan--maltose-1-phosphate maltosyltransferase n=1 Tax=Streptomyces sp. HSG2 TaxID=2797167 RepID=UPI00190490C1|nr:alpha-1,4-glucan--maltose-1-phosphate maltosyltransferase [Streptomyces sp. HSG2]